MEAVTVNPREVAEALGITLWDLGYNLRRWAKADLERVAERAGKEASDLTLDEFDELVSQARNELAGGIACEQAWAEDNPDDEDE